MQKTSVKVKMFTLRILILLSTVAFVKSDLVIKPRDTEAMIGDSTHFDCASDVNTNEVLWYHYAVGARDYEDICIYCLGRIHPRYENRIEVERSVNTHIYRLRLKSLQQQDAGRYVCQDNGGIGESSSAQLVILESSPKCKSNMRSDGLLGPNNCGFERDILHLSCQVSYHGNIPPVIQWRKQHGTEDFVNPTSCQNIDNQFTCNITMTADLGLNGASYICETNRSATTKQYNCVSDIIRVIYLKSENSTSNIVQGGEKNFTCSVNTSQSCNHTWKWFDEMNEEIVAYESSLAARKPGWYQCEIACNIRGRRCTELSKLVQVSEPQNDIFHPGPSVNVFIAVCCCVAIAVALIAIGLTNIYLRTRTTPHARNGILLTTEASKELLTQNSNHEMQMAQHVEAMIAKDS